MLDHLEQAWLADLAKALVPLRITLTLPAPEAKPKRTRPLLVGREREQAVLRAQLDRMLAGHGGVVLVGGEAGIGKTTLVEDLSVQAEEQGSLVVWGHAYDLSVTPPYGPWFEIFREYRSQSVDLPAVPDFVGNTEALAKVGNQDTLFTAMGEFFQGVATQRALVLVLDDLHWADQASLDFFRVLARQVARQRILLIATYRTDELARRHPLYTLLPLLVREAGAVRLEVHPLDAIGHLALIRERYALSEGDQARLEQYLVERAEGNPLYAGELLRTLEEERVVRRDGDHWVLGDLERVQVPRLLMQVIEGRLARLSEETRAQLQIAAVIGQAVPLGLWQQVSGASDDALVTAIEAGQAAQLLIEIPGESSYQFRHALLREALYQEVGALRRRLRHRQVADVLAATRSPDPDAVAHHFQQAGDPRASVWLLKAGERAQAAYTWKTAAERFEAALALMTEQGEAVADQAVVLYRIAQLNRYVDVPRSQTLMREARRLAEEAGQAGLAAYCRFSEGLYQCFEGDMRAGLVTMEEGASAWERVSDAGREALAVTIGEADLAGDAGFVFGAFVLELAFAGQLRKAVALGEQRIVAVPAPELRAGQGGSGYADGWLGLALAYAALGKLQMAQQAFTRARALYQTIEHYAPVAMSYLMELALVQLPYFADQPMERLREFVAKGVAAARKASGANPAGSPSQWVAFPILLLQEDWDQAEAVAKSVYEVDIWARRTLVSGALAKLAWARGDTAMASRVIDGIMPAGPSTHPGNTILSAALPLQRLAVQLALDAQDLPTARAWLEAHDRWLAWSGAVLGRAEGTLLWGQYHRASGDAELARKTAEESLAQGSDPRQPLALIAVQRFLGRLDTEAHRFDAAEAHLQESLQLAEACQAPFERALTLLELAGLRVAQGKTSDAHGLLDEVQAICEPLGAKPTLDRGAALREQSHP